MTDRTKPTIAELIAGTPGAQPIQQALASIKARRDKLLSKNETTKTHDFSAPEPMPVLADPDAFAKGFFERLQNPPRGAKPRLVVSNDPPDDDPEPPKAA